MAYHIKHLKAVFTCLKEAGVMLNPKKYRIVCDEVEYLGHVVTPHGLSPKNCNVDTTRNFPPATTVCILKQLQQFLGLTLYYHRPTLR